MTNEEIKRLDEEARAERKQGKYFIRPISPEDTKAWKSAMFMIRFMKESSLNDFFRAYYGDEEGNPTRKSEIWVKMPKKRKVEKLRELLRGLDDETKWRIVDSPEGRLIDKKAKDASDTISKVSLGSGLTGLGVTIASFLAGPGAMLMPLIWTAGISVLLSGSAIANKIITKNKKSSINRDSLVNQLMIDKRAGMIRESYHDYDDVILLDEEFVRFVGIPLDTLI